MKRKIIAVLIMFVCLCLCGCSKESSLEKVAGTWKVDYVIKDGEEIQVDDVDKIGMDFSGMRMILKDTKEAYLTEGNEIDESDWSVVDEILVIDGIKAELKDGKIFYSPIESKQIIFVKESDSQSVE